jgi:hypothetical protein
MQVKYLTKSIRLFGLQDREGCLMLENLKVDRTIDYKNTLFIEK